MRKLIGILAGTLLLTYSAVSAAAAPLQGEAVSTEISQQSMSLSLEEFALAIADDSYVAKELIDEQGLQVLCQKLGQHHQSYLRLLSNGPLIWGQTTIEHWETTPVMRDYYKHKLFAEASAYILHIALETHITPEHLSNKEIHTEFQRNIKCYLIEGDQLRLISDDNVPTLVSWMLGGEFTAGPKLELAAHELAELDGLLIRARVVQVPTTVDEQQPAPIELELIVRLDKKPSIRDPRAIESLTREVFPDYPEFDATHAPSLIRLAQLVSNESIGASSVIHDGVAAVVEGMYWRPDSDPAFARLWAMLAPEITINSSARIGLEYDL